MRGTPKPGDMVSHGFCEECLAKEMTKLKQTKCKSLDHKGECVLYSETRCDRCKDFRMAKQGEGKDGIKRQ
jgi:hypothetical protein